MDLLTLRVSSCAFYPTGLARFSGLQAEIFSEAQRKGNFSFYVLAAVL
ncbi:hypothetical protein [uncultured Akkermansia sp.]|nr:hypothetical protein [uncultured Akkermansia sp.]